jgi:hypothetical protein
MSLMPEAPQETVPTSEQLEELSLRLMRDYEPRFKAANKDLVIGPMRSLISRGLGLEINGEWASFQAARWSLLRRRWLAVRSLGELETTVRKYLDAELPPT